MDKHVDDVRQERRLKKGRLLGVLAMALVAVLFVGGTLAYFTVDTSASARFALGGGTKVELLNSWNSANGSGKAGVGLLQGDSVNDTVRVRNVGSDCYLRIRMRITKNASADDATTVVKPEELAALSTVDSTTLDKIVGTLYNDNSFDSKAVDNVKNVRGVKVGTGENGTITSSALTPTQSATDGEANVKVVAFTRSTLTGTPAYGYIANSLSSYTTNDRDVARAGAWASNTLKGDFLNVTTTNEYKNGLLTFEYVGGTYGALGSAVMTEPLITTVCIPMDDEYKTPLTGGTLASTGETVGYTITFWAESVPVADFANASVSGSTDAEKAEARRVLAMKRLDDIYESDRYYPAGE